MGNQYIHGRKLIEELHKAGLVGPLETISEVTVIANVRDAVRIRVEHVGTKNLISHVVPTITVPDAKGDEED
jgi:hypothetical protein